MACGAVTARVREECITTVHIGTGRPALAGLIVLLLEMCRNNIDLRKAKVALRRESNDCGVCVCVCM